MWLLGERGDKNSREKKVVEAFETEKEGTKLTKESMNKEKIVLAKEGDVLQTAVRKTRECFKYVHDHYATLQPRSKHMFNTHILESIQNIGGTKAK